MNIRLCLLCIDGMMPAGVDPIFGPVYRACPHCHTRCLDCDGTALFPAIRDYTLDAVLNVLYQLGHQVQLCNRCTGINTLRPPQHADTINRAENLLRHLVDDYYAHAQTYMTAPDNPVTDKALTRARMTAIADIGDKLATALGIAGPDWDLIREIANPDPWSDR